MPFVLHLPIDKPYLEAPQNCSYSCFLFHISPYLYPLPLQYTFPFMKTPLFQYNSMYDTWQIPNILQVTCKFPDGCPEAEKEAVLGYRKVMYRIVSTLCNNVIIECFNLTLRGDLQTQADSR